MEVDSDEPGGGVATQQYPQHRVNELLPSYKERIPAEGERLLADIMSILTTFAAERDDTMKVLRACSGLERMRDLKYHLTDEARLELVRILHSLAFPEHDVTALPWRVGSKILFNLAVLIGKKAGHLALQGRFFLQWRPILAALEDSALRDFPQGSSRQERARLAALTTLVNEARRYWVPGADREIWDHIKGELRRVQTQGAFNALFILCMFLPSRTSLYDELLPEWFSLWGQVDHCSAWDGAWLTLFCRARKHASAAFDWTPYMADLYSHARACIHTPISVGDAGSALLPAARQVTYQYQVFAPPASRYPMRKTSKLAKLLVFLLGKGGPGKAVRVSDVTIVPPADEREAGSQGASVIRERVVSPGALDLLSLFRSLRTYFHPSNGGRWSVEIANLTLCISCSLARRVGAESALREVRRTPDTGELMRDDAGIVTEALLPLVMEMVYSKSRAVLMIASACLSALAELSPKSVAPAAAELILRALDPVASINHTHQAPAALEILTSVFRPLMYPKPYLAQYLPAILELSLPGLDPSDVFKTTVTLQLYFLILCWLPVKGNSVDSADGSLCQWKPPPPAWLDASDEDRDDEELYIASENLSGVMPEWSAALLDRLFEILRHKDKTSKVKAGDLGSDTMNVAAAVSGLGDPGGGSGGGLQGMLASMMGGAGRDGMLVSLIGLVTQQLFTMMDGPAGEMAAVKVLRFVTDSALPNAEKDVARMVEMLAWARPDRTVANFFPALCEGLLVPGAVGNESPVLAPGVSVPLLRWRLRLLSGLARGAGQALVTKRATLRGLIAAGIKHNDKSVRKCARKLLRKALIGLSEMFPADTRSLPPTRWANANSAAEWRRICEPVPPGEHAIVWKEPTADGLALAAELLQEFLHQPMQELSAELSKELAEGNHGAVNGAAASAPGVWREQLKTMDYALRGGICLLGDRGTPGEDDLDVEDGLRDDLYLAVGSHALLALKTAATAAEGPRLFALVAGLRAGVARFLLSVLEACAKGKGPVDVKSSKLAIRLSQRIACTRGANAHLVRRQKTTLRVFKSQQKSVLSAALAKARLGVALEAAVAGDAATATAARRLLATTGTGGAVSHPRVWVVGRSILQHYRRMSMAPRAIAYGAKDAAHSRDAEEAGPAATVVVRWSAAAAVLDRYRALFDALKDLASAEYAMVRAAAQVGVNRVGGVYPWMARSIVPGLINVLSTGGQDDLPQDSDKVVGNGEAAHRRLTGACYLLHQTRSMRHVASKWSLLRMLLLALCDSQTVLTCLPTDKQEKAAARVTILFTSYVSMWRANPIADEKDKAEHDALLDGLLKRLAAFSGGAPSTSGGWRYQLMASWCLMHLIRPAALSAPNTTNGSGESDSPATVADPTPTVRASPMPMAVWRWFADCLSGGDGQPLQKVALGALSRLLLSTAAPHPAGRGSEVSEMLRSRAFLEPFFRALAHNHKKQATEGGGSAGAEQWSLGVKEVVQDAGRGDRELFPRLRFTARSRLFWARNARLVSAVIAGIAPEHRGESIRVLLEEVARAKGAAAHEDKRSFDCAAAEVGAGVVAVLARKKRRGEGDGREQTVLRDVLIPFIDTELEGVSLEGTFDWTDAIRYALDGSSATGAEPLVSKLVERTVAVLQGGGKGRDDYSVLVKWLSFIGAVLIELSAREGTAATAERIAQELCPLLVEGLDHPFKACREEIARNLFLVTNATDTVWAVGVAEEVRKSIEAEAAEVEENSGGQQGSSAGAGAGEQQALTNGLAILELSEDGGDASTLEATLLASALTLSDGAPSEEQEASANKAAKRLSRRRETVLQWMHQTTTAGDHHRYLPILVSLLPVALQCVRDSTAEVAAMGRGASLSSVAALTARNRQLAATSTSTSTAATQGGADMKSTDETGAMIDAVLAAAAPSQSSWRVRRNAVAVQCVLQTTLHFVLTPAEHSAADATLLSLLGDPRREVQETARLAMSTRVAHLTPAQTRALCQSFATEADRLAASRTKRRKIAKRRATAAAAAAVPAGVIGANAAGGGAAAIPAVAGGKMTGSSRGEEDAAGALLLASQQTSVLGLSAVILAAPCDVPPWVPAALESLAKHANDESPGRLPVRHTVSHTFKEFRRTHQDKWEDSHKSRFTRDQLDTFDEVLGGAHSYFV